MNIRRPSFIDSIPPVVKNLLAINIVLSLATFVLPGISAKFGFKVDLTDILGMHYWESSKFNPAQLLTYAFMHAGFFHILFNMLGVFMFGRILENLWGPKKFLIYYLFTALGAAIVQQLFWTFEYHSVVTALHGAANSGSIEGLLPFENILRQNLGFGDLKAFDSLGLIELKDMFVNSLITVGASGSVLGMVLAFGWLFPQQTIYIYFFPVKARLAVVIFTIMELSLGVAQFSFDSIAHFAHLGGMLFGTILLLIWRNNHTLYRK